LNREHNIVVIDALGTVFDELYLYGCIQLFLNNLKLSMDPVILA